MWPTIIDGYLEYLQAAGVAPGTLRLRQHYLNHLAARFHDRDPRELALEDLCRFVGRPGWQPESRKSARAAVRGLYGWAHKVGRVPADPSVFLPTVPVPAGKPRPAPDGVLARALAAASTRDRRMVLLAALGGLRRAEISRVHTDDILGEELRVVGKGGRIRHVPLHPVVLGELAYVPAGWVFPGKISERGRDGGHLSADRVGHILADLLGPGWTAHTLRHRFASRAYAAERDLRAVQELLGHAKPETTARYTAVPDGALRAAVLAAGDAA